MKKQSAFPYVCDADFEYGTGMTLRDYFAAKAMQAIITNHKLEECDDFIVAANAYQLADFMLKERDK